MNPRFTERRITNEEIDRRPEPRLIREVLAELLAHYADRFPEARIAVVHTASNTL